MFAVKGWNLDATVLKPQTEVFKSALKPDQNGEQKSRKRKRDDRSAGEQNQDVGQLWEQHIEGKPPKSKKEVKKDRKKQKQNHDTANNVPVNEARKAEREQTKAGAEEEKKPAKKDKKQKNKDKKSLQNGGAVTPKGDDKKDAPPLAPKPKVSAGAKLTPMQAAMRQKLISARFRHLNETLYTEQSAKALELFNENPEMFEDYHSGFRQQVSVWPENPVDNFISTLRARGGVRLPSQKHVFKNKKRMNDAPEIPSTAADGRHPALPRTHGTAIIADLGCGDARLAQTFKDSGDGQKLQLKIHSYDLHSPSPLVTKADISNLPAADGSVDVAIFCLALMGTNWISFIEEAYRILHWKGELWIAEIKSRFGRVGRAGKPVEHSVGGKRKQAAIKKVQEAKKKEQEEVNETHALAVEVDGVETKNQETDVSAFVDVLKRRGFLLKNGDSSIDLSNKMFVKMEFVKAAAPTKGKNKPEESAKPTERFKKTKAKFLEEENENEIATEDEGKVLKPCLYKIR